MDQRRVQVRIEGNETASWRQRCNLRLQILRQRSQSQNIQYPPEAFGSNNSVIFELHEAVQNGNVDNFVDVLDEAIFVRRLVLSAIFDQVTPAGDSLLHEAAYFGKEEIAELIGYHFPDLLTKTNIDGDTPLHVAARSKSSDVIKVILSQYKAHRLAENEEIITRLTNTYGNTALHEAVYSNIDLEGVKPIFDADNDMAHYLNKSKVSPLYLAVQNSNEEIVDRLFEVPFTVDPLPRCHGISPLHAAISAKKADLLDKMVMRKPNLMTLIDEHGGNPMHFAASAGYLEGVHILLRRCPQAALEYSTEGHLPIHLASKQGHVEVVKKFCEEKWDPRCLLNKKGQNVLHVAAEHGQDNVVQYLLRDPKLNINKKDQSGNTPLHLAAGNLHYSTIVKLTLDHKRIDANIKNNEGLTARDIVLLKKEIQRGVLQELTNLVLKFAGSQKSDKAEGMLKCQEPLSADMMKNKMDTLMVVAILIVTVTFAAGFTVPGGVHSFSEVHAGRAVLGHKTMYKIFSVSNMIAMYSSTFGSFFLLWAQIGKLRPLSAFSSALFMVGIALLSMTVAFMAASNLVVNHVSWLATFTVVVGISSFCAILIWSNATWSIFMFLIVPRYRKVYDAIGMGICGILVATVLVIVAAFFVGGFVLLVLSRVHKLI